MSSPASLADPESVVVLLSGGVDSATVCLWLQHHGYRPLPLFVDYGQRSAMGECVAADRVARALRLPSLRRVDASRLTRGFHGPLFDDAGACFARPTTSADGEGKSLGEEFVPQRNLLLATVAAQLAHNEGATGIALGLVQGGPSYPDTTTEFVEALQRVLDLGSPLRVFAPFVSTSKYRLLGYGQDRGFDYTLTFSCSVGPLEPCGRCVSCRARSRHFADADLEMA